MREKPFLTLQKITARLRDRMILPDTSWVIRKGENWAVLGPNGAGKSTLARILTEDVPCVQGTLTRHGRNSGRTTGYVSFELHERLIAEDEQKDHARYFSGDLKSSETAREAILSGNSHRRLSRVFNRVVDLLEIRHLLDREIRFLSTGEMRKILIARALVKSPRFLILDEPFGGLDISARRQLGEMIGRLMEEGVQVVLVTNRTDEVLPGISHVICVRSGQVILQGQKEDILTSEVMGRLYETRGHGRITGVDRYGGRGSRSKPNPRVLVEIKDVTVQYDDVTILQHLSWIVRKGENWAVIGPNGAGKTTLLRLISGDNLQAYANEIYLFGKRRGSGESIWEIKERIGIVSSEFQVRYRKDVTAFDVVASGLFDSIGLYRRLTEGQNRRVRETMQRLGLWSLAKRNFHQLSYGERRMILIARALVKSPPLLILDEPCQGLDRANRALILAAIDRIGQKGMTTLIYVTHHEKEIPSSIHHILRLKKKGAHSIESRDSEEPR